jgi:hypothetical protein
MGGVDHGVGFDGLSKYDLTKFNPWYFGRLREFTDLADQKGLVLVNQMFFQHHLLEDVAHWMDVPWRVTNALQDLGLPEPPPTESRKRIIIANIYYDVEHNANLREFHRNFIRHHLENFPEGSNVIQVIGDEYSGPLSFMQFWLDTIAEWEKETGRHPLVALSCNKDVQDAILADPVRSKVVDIIDMKYWWYTADGKMYNPPGGEEVAPRKQLTGWKGSKSRSDESTARQVRDYRDKYPEKAIMCSYDRVDGWAQACAGGSIAALRADEGILRDIPRMKPVEQAGLRAGQYALEEEGKAYLVYSMSGNTIKLDVKGEGEWEADWVDMRSGKATATGTAKAGVQEFKGNGNRVVLWLRKK